MIVPSTFSNSFFHMPKRTFRHPRLIFPTFLDGIPCLLKVFSLDLNPIKTSSQAGLLSFLISSSIVAKMPSQGKAINLQTTTGRQVPACWHLWCKELNLFLIVLTHVANPYVPKSHRVAVVLELDGPFGCVRLLVVANTSVPSRAWIFLFVVQSTPL